MKKKIGEQEAILLIGSCISSNNNFTNRERENNIKCLKGLLNFFNLPMYLRSRCKECIALLENEIKEENAIQKKHIEEYSKKI